MCYIYVHVCVYTCKHLPNGVHMCVACTYVSECMSVCKHGHSKLTAQTEEKIGLSVSTDHT